MRKHSVESVISDLRKKGVIITLESPLTKREASYKPIQAELVTKKALEKGLTKEEVNEALLQGVLLKKLGITPEKEIVEVVVQQPFTVNTAQAIDVGNGSLGKIDFLVNHNGFTWTNIFIDNTELLETVKISENEPRKAKTEKASEKKKIYTKLSRTSKEA